MWVKKELVDELKSYFMRRDGTSVRDILKPASGSQAPIDLLEKGRGGRKEKQRDFTAQDNQIAAEEHQQSIPEASDAPHPEAPPEKKKKDRRRRLEES
jgi:hypothetical protein